MGSIVEYATRDQAQTAINTLSNQNLMGRLIYVREVSFRRRAAQSEAKRLDRIARQNLVSSLARLREADMRGGMEEATEAAAGSRAATAAEATEAGVVVVWACKADSARSTCPTFVSTLPLNVIQADILRQLPFQVGWQDLKDLFRQAGTYPSA